MEFSYLHEVCILRAWRKDNMYADFIASEKSPLDANVILLNKFPQRLTEAVMKDIHGFCYEWK